MLWPEHHVVYRPIGRMANTDRLGIGFMDKTGIAVDHLDYRAPTYSLVYLLRGTGTYTDDAGRQFELGPGSCFQRQPGVVHTTRPDPDSGWLEAFYDLGGALFGTLSALNVIRAEPKVFRRGIDLAAIERQERLCRSLESASECDLPRFCSILIGEIVDAQRGATPAVPRRDSGGVPKCSDVSLARAMLSEEPMSRVRLKTWCAGRGIEYGGFRKRFHKQMGVSPTEYRIRERMHRAQSLLETTFLTIEAIAAQLGYASPYEFSAQFTRRLGMPPSRYRREHAASVASSKSVLPKDA